MRFILDTIELLRVADVVYDVHFAPLLKTKEIVIGTPEEPRTERWTYWQVWATRYRCPKLPSPPKLPSLPPPVATLRRRALEIAADERARGYRRLSADAQAPTRRSAILPPVPADA